MEDGGGILERLTKPYRNILKYETGLQRSRRRHFSPSLGSPTSPPDASG